MVDEDQGGRAREAAGDEVGTCDLCGRVTADLWLEPAVATPEGQDPVEMIRVCAECRGRLAVDDLPFDAQIGARLQPSDE